MSWLHVDVIMYPELSADLANLSNMEEFHMLLSSETFSWVIYISQLTLIVPWPQLTGMD